MTRFEPTRTAGLQRLEAFSPHAGRAYARSRNYDREGAFAAVSGLSPYLRHRLISEIDVLGAVLKHNSLHEAMPFVQEVFWRGYFKGWLEQHPSVWATYQSDLAEALQDPPRGFYNAVSGCTGIECFDYWVQQLLEVGYLHNHARMWFASIWIFTLQLPWQMGADFFLRHLADADPASNTLSWRWVAGLHTKGKHYLATAENIARFTDGRFQPSGQLNETANAVHEDREHPQVPLARSSTAPLSKAVWVVTEEDCLPPPSEVSVTGVVGIVSPSASAFAQSAVEKTTRLLGGTFHRGHDWSRAILLAVQTAQVSGALCTHLPVGPAANGFVETQHRLALAGVRLHHHIRRYDQLVWPHASKGFFRLKKQIPSLVSELAL